MNTVPRQTKINNLSLPIGIAIITAAAGSSLAAEIKVLGIGDNYQLKISGPIESGDTDKLRAAIAEHTAFPDGLLIESDAGDTTESMAIGHFLRDNMLTVTAGKQCSNTCFLIWAGGVHRKARGPIDARVIAADKDQLRTYLTDMEITEEVISKAASSEQAPLTDAMTDANEYSARHQQWLADQCGALTDRQERDRQAVQALESVEASLNAMGMGGSSMYTVSAETQREAARAREFSQQYRDELQKNYSEISGCHKNAIAFIRAEQNST
jgi:hypothetical protein